MSDALPGHLHGWAQPENTGNDRPRKWPCGADKGGCYSLRCHVDPECFGEGLGFQAAMELITLVPRDRGVECDYVILV